jgi:hypothetical protein
MAIDFATMKAYVGSHAHDEHLNIYDLPTMGVGEDIADWPIVQQSGQVAKFWDRGNRVGVMIRDGKLWVNTKVFYDMSPGTLKLYGKDLETGEVETLPVNLSQPAFGAGFIKGHPLQWMIGCGGYESGQGSVAGPTAALVDGTILLDQANHGAAFELRERRPANYSAATDTWMTLNPRDGVGVWAADRVYGGGVWRPDGLCFWPIMGIGDIDYARQSETFSIEQQSMFYTYDPQSYDQVAFEPWAHGSVVGQEVNGNGRVYLLTRDAWASTWNGRDNAIKVFEVVQ